MLREPEAPVTPALRVPREIDGVAEGARGIAPFDYRREIEDRERDHDGNDSRRPARAWRMGRPAVLARHPEITVKPMNSDLGAKIRARATSKQV